MGNDFERWLRANAPVGQFWTGRLLPLAAAGSATALVGLSVILMAGIGLAPVNLAQQASAAAARAPVAGTTVRYAQDLPTVTVVGRRQPLDQVSRQLLPAFGAAATVGMSAAGDNLRQ